MKSLAIALLLTVSVCVGQESFGVGEGIRAATDTIEFGVIKKIGLAERFGTATDTVKFTPFYFDTTDKVINPPTFEDLYNARLEDFAMIFVILWDEYAKECWADSSYGFIHHPDKTCWYSWSNKCMAEGHWRQEWIHPTKPTLEGFAGFLRRKTK